MLLPMLLLPRTVDCLPQPASMPDSLPQEAVQYIALLEYVRVCVCVCAGQVVFIVNKLSVVVGRKM